MTVTTASRRGRARNEVISEAASPAGAGSLLEGRHEGRLRGFYRHRGGGVTIGTTLRGTEGNIESKVNTTGAAIGFKGSISADVRVAQTRTVPVPLRRLA